MKPVPGTLVEDERVQAPILVALFTLPFLALLLWARVWLPAPDVHLSDTEKAAIFFLAFGGFSSIFRLCSKTAGRVLFQGYCAFVCVASLAASLWSLYQAYVEDFGILGLPPFGIALAVAWVAWRIRATDQKGWREEQSS